MLTITLPIYWTRGVRKPKTSLMGMNWYRNAHFQEQNKFKQEFGELVLNQIKGNLIKFDKFETDIKVFYKSKVCDPSNIVPLTEKVILDTLQSAGILKQDNVQHHIRGTWSVAGLDKDNPRCEITIKSYKEPK